MARPEDLGRYRLRRLLGRGAHGEVWEASDLTEPGAKVAVKIVRGAEEGVALARARLAREAQLAAGLRHPHVAAVRDAGEAAGTAFLVMDLVEGRSLRRVLAAPEASLAQRLRWLRELAEALAALHHAGIAHRDLKPENVIVRADGSACLVDLGVVKGRARDAIEPPSEQEPREASRYLPPEVEEAGVHDALGDQYAWGVLAYEVLAGAPPDDGASLPAGVSPRLAAAIDRARARARAERWPGMASLVEELRRDHEGPRSASRRSFAGGPRSIMVRPVAPLPFATRLWFAWVVFVKVLLDGLFAAKLFAPRLEGPAEPAAPAPEPAGKVTEVVVERVVEKIVERPAAHVAPPTDAALQLLALLQREGRLIDFLEEDVASFSDADVGAAARVVHTGCRKALREHVTLAPVRAEAEGARVTIAEVRPGEVKLTGNVQGSGPHTGVLRHKGWRATSVALPTAVAGHDASVVAQAEVEL